MSDKTEIYEEVCPFCGKKRNVRVMTKDFWEEYRGNSWEETSYSNEYCNCTFGKMCKEKVEITPCCENCIFNKSGECTCENTCQHVSSFFDCPQRLKIKDTTKVCGNYKFNPDIFLDIIDIPEVGRSKRNFKI